jgi:AraC-like DNA-binding protein
MIDSILTILYALPVYQCLVLFILLFISRSESGGSSRGIFGLFNLLLAAYFAFNLLYRVKAFQAIAYIYYPILPVILCLIPTFYLYILSITEINFRLKAKHALHFIPAAGILLLNTPFLFMSFTQKIQYLSFTFNFQKNDPLIMYLLVIYVVSIFIIVNIQLVVYLILTIRQYQNHLSFIESHFSNTEQIDTAWTRSFMISFLIFFIINNMLYIIGFRQHPLAGILYTLSMLGITLFAGVRGLNQKETVIQSTADTGEPVPQTQQATEEGPVDHFPENRNEQLRMIKYQGSSLTDEQKQVLAKKLKLLMQNEKVFTQSNLTIDHLAQRLQTNSKYISQIINEFYQQNYFQFINAYRIEEAKQLLTSPAGDKYSILGISSMAGFASKSTFNTAFKKITGVTPSEFKEQRDTSRALDSNSR